MCFNYHLHLGYQGFMHKYCTFKLPVMLQKFSHPGLLLHLLLFLSLPETLHRFCLLWHVPWFGHDGLVSSWGGVDGDEVGDGRDGGRDVGGVGGKVGDEVRRNEVVWSVVLFQCILVIICSRWKIIAELADSEAGPGERKIPPLTPLSRHIMSWCPPVCSFLL